MKRILIVDDEKNVLSSFHKILTQEGYEVSTASSAEEGLSVAQNNAPDLLIMDIKMSGLSGLEAFSRFKEIDSLLPIIIMTAYGTTETAIEAMKLGAFDYVIKPFDVPQMKGLIKKALEASRLMKTRVTYEEKKEFSGDRIVGATAKMQEIYKTIGQIAESDVTVLIQGLSGTGKELIARAIYQHSRRRLKPFLVINAAAIPETLLESELFGYEKGAFTDARERRIGKLEQCNGGTVFLDEIGDMPASIQAKILRVLEDKSFERLGSNKTIKVDVRLITATNRNLEALIKEGKFREDLYYRLNVVMISLPPLRERKEEISLLVEYFISKYSKEFKKHIDKISPEALSILKEQSWPGNIRELENMLKKAMLFAKTNIILPQDLLFTEQSETEDKDLFVQLRQLFGRLVKQEMTTQNGSLYKNIVEEVEKTLIIEALKYSQGNQSQTAKLLGISRPTLSDKIEKLGIKRMLSLQADT